MLSGWKVGWEICNVSMERTAGCAGERNKRALKADKRSGKKRIKDFEWAFGFWFYSVTFVG